MITNALLERMHETAAFSDNENVKLQEFADLCAVIESQIAYLPGLACLNFPNAIQPIVEKLPSSLHRRWEKDIAKHYEENAGAYPGFVVFSKIVQNQAKIKTTARKQSQRPSRSLTYARSYPDDKSAAR